MVKKIRDIFISLFSFFPRLVNVQFGYVQSQRKVIACAFTSFCLASSIKVQRLNKAIQG